MEHAKDSPAPRPMRPAQAIAAMRALHAGGYYATAKWETRLDRRASLKPERDAARAELMRLREEIGREDPTADQRERIKALRNICFSHRCLILRDESFYKVHVGYGDTWEEAVEYARAARKRDAEQAAEYRRAAKAKAGAK